MQLQSLMGGKMDLLNMTGHEVYSLFKYLTYVEDEIATEIIERRFK